MVSEPQIQRADCEIPIWIFKYTGISTPNPDVIQGSTVFLCAIHCNMHSSRGSHIPGLIDSTCGILLTQVASEEASLILVPPVFLKMTWELLSPNAC